MRRLYLAGWTFLGLTGLLAIGRGSPGAGPLTRYDHPPVSVATAGGEAARWFAAIRPHCNAVEVETRHRWTPPPTDGFQAAGYSAACYALAGMTDRSREIIDRLDSEDRWRAAGIVFEVGHPVADAGDDRSAGPIMELVVDYWPNHYMALYHAGMARLGLGDRAGARGFLERFLEHYSHADGWTRSAREALAGLERP